VRPLPHPLEPHKEQLLTLPTSCRGHRRAESVGSPTISADPASQTFLTAVPEVVQDLLTVTISNTEAASPETTAQAVGATQAAVGPLTCAPSVPFGGSCDPNANACWCVPRSPSLLHPSLNSS